MKENFRDFSLDLKDTQKEPNFSSEIRGLIRDTIPDKIIELFKTIRENNNIEKLIESSTYNPEDHFIIKDKIILVNDFDIDRGGSRKLEIKLEINGKLKDLKKIYLDVLKNKLSDLNIDEENLYAIYNWEQEFNVFDEKEKEINEETGLKSSFDGNLVLNGKISD